MEDKAFNLRRRLNTSRKSNDANIPPVEHENVQKTHGCGANQASAFTNDGKRSSAGIGGRELDRPKRCYKQDYINRFSFFLVKLSFVLFFLKMTTPEQSIRFFLDLCEKLQKDERKGTPVKSSLSDIGQTNVVDHLMINTNTLLNSLKETQMTTQGENQELYVPDYGGLKINFLSDGEERKVQYNPWEFQGSIFSLPEDDSVEHDDWVMEYGDLEWKQTFAYDDDTAFEQREECLHLSWVFEQRPNCNLFHEIDLLHESNFYLSEGSYRQAFSVNQGATVLKIMRYELEPNHEFRDTVVVDAVVMEKMSRSERIINSHGYCGISVMVEPKYGPNIGELIYDGVYETPLSSSEKLTLSLRMAEAIADLHGFEDGVIVHSDIFSEQFLFDENNQIYLTDFNRADFLEYNKDTNGYCKFYVGVVRGWYRSPEEINEELVNEKIDVYSFGNILFTILSGERPYDHFDDDIGYHRQIIDGKPPFNDFTLNPKDFAEEAISQVMIKCFEHCPEERIDIFEIVKLLREAVEENNRLQQIPKDHSDDNDYYAEEYPFLLPKKRNDLENEESEDESNNYDDPSNEDSENEYPKKGITSSDDLEEDSLNGSNMEFEGK